MSRGYKKKLIFWLKSEFCSYGRGDRVYSVLHRRGMIGAGSRSTYQTLYGAFNSTVTVGVEFYILFAHPPDTKLF